MSNAQSSPSLPSEACYKAASMPIATAVSIEPMTMGRVMQVHAPSAASATASEEEQRLVARKKAMRKAVEAQLAELNSDALAARSAALQPRVQQLPAYQRATALALFVSMPSGEVQTDGLLAQALRDGKTLFVPRIEMPTKGGASGAAASTVASAGSVASSSSDALAPPPPVPPRMKLLHVVDEADLASFAPNRWGIRQPPLTYADGRPRREALDCDELTLVLCPGVAFDAACRRLGHGKGYYDEYLRKLRQLRRETGGAEVAAIALAFDEQIVQQVPLGETDVPIDAVITPTQHYTKEH